MEDSSQKAQYVYYCEEYLEEEDKEKIKNISDLSDHVTHYKYGDLVAFSEYRDTETYLIGKKGKLIPTQIIQQQDICQFHMKLPNI